MQFRPAVNANVDMFQYNGIKWMSTVGRKSNRERIHQEIETEKTAHTKKPLESIFGFGNPVSWLSNLAHAMPSSIHRIGTNIYNKLMKQQDI